jgi:bud site selection protein 31
MAVTCDMKFHNAHRCDTLLFNILRSSIMPLPPRLQNLKNQNPGGSSKRGRNGNVPPAGFEYIQPVLEALENELRDAVKHTDPKQRKLEAMWPVHQINYQKTRYVYDMYYVHHKISKHVYQFCINKKYIDAALAAKWKKPGYERLCSTYVINPTNYKFGTTSICRVPLYERSESAKYAQDPTVRCRLNVILGVTGSCTPLP